MKVKINKEGILEIERNGEFKSQFCPFIMTSIGDMVNCGDWCPLFGEPELLGHTITLEICRTKFVLNDNDFKDERE